MGLTYHLRWLSVAVVLAAGPVFAHDIWITTAMDGEAMALLIHHGHPGDRKIPDPDKLFELDAIGEGGLRLSLVADCMASTRDGVPVLVSKRHSPAGGSWLFSARYDNGFWIKTPAGHRNTSKRQVQGGSESLASMKYAKTLVRVNGGSSDLHGLTVGHRLELVPLSDPFVVKPGDTMMVRVLFEGRPLVDAQVEIGDGVTPMEEKDIPRYRTDAQGVATLPIRKPGLQLIVVDHFTPPASPDLADRDLHNATLTFVVSSPGR